MHPIHARIYKIDEKTQTVHGRAAQEVVDRSNEIFDYSSSLPFFRKWSAECFADSNQQSYGNVRSMHSNVAAGKIIDIDFNDVEKAIDITAKIVDPVEWEKCISGVYTGFSIGGSYAKKWTDVSSGKAVVRYTACPTEVSIVDRPACPTAKFFQIHKRDGSVIRRAFQFGDTVMTPALSKFLATHGSSLVAVRQIHAAGSTLVAGFRKSVDPQRLHKRHRRIGRQEVDLHALSKSIRRMRKGINPSPTLPPNSSNAFDAERAGNYGQTRQYADEATDVTRAPTPMDNRARAAAVIAMCLKTPAGQFGG